MAITPQYTPINSPTTIATITGQGVTLPQIWDLKCRKSRETTNYFESAETSIDDPEGPNALVITKNETSAGVGQQVNFRTKSGYYGEGKRGENLFTAVEDFQKNDYGQYSAYVGVYRNATSWNEFTTEETALRDEIGNGAPEALGGWLGRLMTETIDLRVRDKAHATSLFTANSRAFNNIYSADILDLNNMLKVASQMSTLGGKPARVGKVNGQPVNKYVWGPVTEVATSLKTSSDYQALLKYSNTGIDYMLKGEIATLDNQIVRPYEVVNHDGYGPIGSARFPMGYLGVAIAAGTATFDVKFGPGGGTDTEILYAKNFFGYAYNWVPNRATEVLAANPIIGGADFTTTKYLLIVNPPNAESPYVPNGCCVYEYTTGNNGNKIEILRRLGASGAGGARVLNFGTGSTTAALINANGGTFTDTHPVGATVYQCNIKGVPLAFTPCYGAGGILRPYGLFKQRRDKETKEGGFVYQAFLRSYFGTQLAYDRLNRTPGVATIAHAVSLPQHQLPVMTSALPYAS